MARRFIIIASAGSLVLTAGLAFPVSASAAAANASTWTRLAGGDESSCGVKRDGTLWCWGANDDGQLGSGNHLPSSVPVQVGTDANWIDAAVGYVNACGVRSDGTAWCWGQGGALGDGTSEPSDVPVQVSGAGWTSIAVGNRFACGVQGDGSLWCWGNDAEAELGDGPLYGGYKLSPVRIGVDTTWATVSTGVYSSCALDTNGHAACWGWNWTGAVGVGRHPRFVVNPTQINTATWTSVSVGVYSACGVQTAPQSGTLWCWGSDVHGAQGQGTLVGKQWKPQQVGSDTDWLETTVGAWFACTLKTDGSPWCWGYNKYGQLGTRMKDVYSPTKVDTSIAWSGLAAGWFHMLGIEAGTSLGAAWGRGTEGELGDAQTRNHYKPTRIK